MIKGVTQNVIEVSTENNPYYEKALLFLKDGKLNQTDITALTDELFKNVPPSFIRKSRVKATIKIVIAVALGAVVSAAICTALYL